MAELEQEQQDLCRTQVTAHNLAIAAMQDFYAASQAWDWETAEEARFAFLCAMEAKLDAQLAMCKNIERMAGGG